MSIAKSMIERFKPIIKRLRRWFLKWVVSENLYRAYNHYRFPKLQKFWFGKPSLPAPPLERSYFDECGLPSSIVRRLDDYRAAAVIKKNGELSLKHCKGSQSIEFAITPAINYDGRHGRAVKLRLGEKETCIYDIPYERWYDIRLDDCAGVDQLIIETDLPIVMTMPRGVVCRPRLKLERCPRHFIVLVLDAWTSFIKNNLHPFTGEPTPTPNIERFFSRGIKATQGISSGQWTLPAVGSLFTDYT